MMGGMQSELLIVAVAMAGSFSGAGIIPFRQMVPMLA